MLQFFRTPALSNAKIGRILQDIQIIAPGVVELKTEISFYVDISRPLTDTEDERLRWLLAETFSPERFSSTSFLSTSDKVIEVGPRLVLVTTWSSSAKVILLACNLDKVNRIEAACRYGLVVNNGVTVTNDQVSLIAGLLYDRMIQEIYPTPLTAFGSGLSPDPVRTIPIMEMGKKALEEFARRYNLNFSPTLLDYIYSYFFSKLHRNPTDVEIFMFGQLNSEHCRHHIFNGRFIIDGQLMPSTMMEMVKKTVDSNPGNLAVAFKDNAAVLQPSYVEALIPIHPEISSEFIVRGLNRGFVLKIETHNHPTTVSPYQGAATGVAVRRDIFGTGRGGVPIGHLAAYYVGNLFIPSYGLSWEKEYIRYSPRFASPLKIMIEASNGASDNCNCFGNPVILGTARSFEQLVGKTHYGYRKTVMAAGSFGYIDESHINKKKSERRMLVVQTGGPAFPIGVGGGSGSSLNAGGQEVQLDFNSVQRDDAFTERGNFNVIRACSELGIDNPIMTMTDLGAGGDCVAIPELVFPGGAHIELRNVPCGDKTMPAWVYWCNESQERMAYLIWPESLSLFRQICDRHRCLMSVIGEVNCDGQFVLTDGFQDNASREQETPIDVDMAWLLADLPQRQIECTTVPRTLEAPCIPDVTIRKHLDKVFRLLDVGSKEYLTHKADRTVGNRSVQQQEVGPFQLPIADCAVMSDGPFGKTGHVIALGEQPIKGLIDNAAGVRMSIGEAFTNVIWAPMNHLPDLNFSATWQWPCGEPGEDARLYQAVKAAQDCMVALLSRIGVGKDSLSMTLKETGSDGSLHPILAPGTVQMVAFGPCCDIDNIITPDFKRPGESELIFIDLAKGKQRLGASALLRVYEQIGDESPDLEDSDFFLRALMAVQELIKNGLILSGHDRSDGGLIGCVSEMAFAGNCGFKLMLKSEFLGSTNAINLLFNEELGLVLESLPEKRDSINKILLEAGIGDHCHIIGQTTDDYDISISYDHAVVLYDKMPELRAIWRETSFCLDKLQSNPSTVDEECINTYLSRFPKYFLSFEPLPTPQSIMIKSTKPKVAILQEAGTNGDRDAAEACYLAGFTAVDICKNDLISGAATLTDCQFLILPGGFSFRDTLDAGKGGAGVFKFNERAADELAAFVAREDTLIFGPCNGCQELVLLGLLPYSGIPTEKLPRFINNKSGRFEHRQVAVMIMSDNNSVFLKDMAGSVLGAIVSHAQGCFYCPDDGLRRKIIKDGLAPVRYVDVSLNSKRYPFNPNGSMDGIAGLSSLNGRILAMMPHPERLCLNNLWPWQPREWKDLKASPWLKMFQNAREWCEQS